MPRPIGMKMPPEVGLLISQALTGKKRGPMSEEQKQIRREAALRNQPSFEEKPTLSRWAELIIKRDRKCQRCGTIEKLAAHHKGVLDRPRLQEVKDKISKKQLGKSVSLETRRKQSEIQIEYNKTRTSEQRKQKTEKAREASPFGNSDFARAAANKRWRRG